MTKRCRVCSRALTSPRWRQVGLGPVCARRLGLRLVTIPARQTLVPVRQVEVYDDQIALFDVPEKGAA